MKISKQDINDMGKVVVSLFLCLFVALSVGLVLTPDHTYNLFEVVKLSALGTGIIIVSVLVFGWLIS